jgi:hypothetical protein
MAKSKAQKQEEALQRKRRLFGEKKSDNIRYNPGGMWYENCKKFQGQELADRRAAENNTAFGRYLREAQLTSEGLPYYPGQKVVVEAGESVLGDIMTIAALTGGKFVKRPPEWQGAYTIENGQTVKRTPTGKETACH